MENSRFKDIKNLVENDNVVKGSNKDIVLDALDYVEQVFDGYSIKELSNKATKDDVTKASSKTAELLKSIYNDIIFKVYEKKESFVVVYKLKTKEFNDKNLDRCLDRDNGVYYDNTSITIIDTKDSISYSNTHAILMADRIFGDLAEQRYGKNES